VKTKPVLSTCWLYNWRYF